MKYYCLIILLCYFSIELFGQHLYSTTSLIVAPTAEMQKEKTIMIGGSMIDHNIYRSSYWSNSREYNPYTFNYYLTSPSSHGWRWAYTCTLVVKGALGSSYWPQQTWGKFTNQDRSFHGRLRLCKEGWWKKWPPK